MLASTPIPPYYSVIFASVKKEDISGYQEMAEKMVELASQSPGFLGMDSASADISITVSYWQDLDSIKIWRDNAAHKMAQKLGREKWYQSFELRIAKVEKAYNFSSMN